ncbi:hypothetical protein GHT06_022599 [Daphnia sinensis]|uniref:Uncharacterized protein n=1 Tax=Daphnia sinensis TaxID=1820382 RepID=A0AAD5PPM5_9CRUS|nr:hypothetical protein GHT06_022599 [Daphnia sinensis]
MDPSTGDGREFRRNRRAINICRGGQKVRAATPPAATQVVPTAVASCRKRASFTFPSFFTSARTPLVAPAPCPATSNVFAPVPSLLPARPPVSAGGRTGPNSQAVTSGVVRNSRKPRELPFGTRSSTRLVAKNRRSVLHSLARSTASSRTPALDPAELVVVPSREVSDRPLGPDQDVVSWRVGQSPWR